MPLTQDGQLKTATLQLYDLWEKPFLECRLSRHPGDINQDTSVPWLQELMEARPQPREPDQTQGSENHPGGRPSPSVPGFCTELLAEISSWGLVPWLRPFPTLCQL